MRLRCKSCFPRRRRLLRPSLRPSGSVRSMLLIAGSVTTMLLIGRPAAWRCDDGGALGGGCSSDSLPDPLCKRKAAIGQWTAASNTQTLALAVGSVKTQLLCKQEAKISGVPWRVCRPWCGRGFWRLGRGRVGGGMEGGAGGGRDWREDGGGQHQQQIAIAIVLCPGYLKRGSMQQAAASAVALTSCSPRTIASIAPKCKPLLASTLTNKV